MMGDGVGGNAISTDENDDSITRSTRNFANTSSAAGFDKKGSDRGGDGQLLLRLH